MHLTENHPICVRMTADEKDKIIRMAWEDRTPFEAILANYNLDESALMKLMRANLKFSSYKLWRKRVKTKSIKHLNLRSKEVNRAYCPTQYKLGR
jgi:uncharacterized protein (TIGR03643 family)